VATVIIIWIARILAILDALFLLAFGLDVFSGSGTVRQKLKGFLMLAAALILWNHPADTGILYIGFGVYLALKFKLKLRTLLLICSPPMLAGALYIAGSLM
jgi:hypothetical protein